MAGAGEATHIRVLQQEVERLHNAVAHLVQSNAELKAAIEEGGDDEDRTFKTAIEVPALPCCCLPSLGAPAPSHLRSALELPAAAPPSPLNRTTL